MMNIAVSALQLESNLQSVFDAQRVAFNKNKFPTLAERRERLAHLKKALLANEQEIVLALSQDYGQRSEFDTLLGDVMPTVQHINYSIKQLAKWMRPERRHAGLALFPSKVEVIHQPLGVVGVIVPWNFPVFLSLGPIVTALAAGNTVMVKLSEYTPNTNRVLSNILESVADSVAVIEGDAEVAAQFSRLSFDHLFFTGSTQVGRYVAKACAENLTPYTLELGGKSPVIIAPDCDINSIVHTILMGKSLNAGQICVAPDYILLPKGKADQFANLYIQAFKSIYKDAKNCYGAIVNQRQFERLKRVLAQASEQGARVISAGEIDNEKRIMAPQILLDCNDSMTVMSEEIFGPILPIIEYDVIDDAIEYVNNHSKPLALYIMSSNKETQQHIIRYTHSGGVCVNDTLIHVGADDAPFGGVGESGIGQYHGREGYATFTNAKTIVTTPTWLPRAKLLLANRALATKLLKKLFVR